MAKEKRKYAVYIASRGDGRVYAKNGGDTFVGETFAVSEKQAINNVRFRNEGKKSNMWIVGDYFDDSAANLHYYYAKEMG